MSTDTPEAPVAATPPTPENVAASDTNVYSITWSDGVTVEEIEAVHVSINGDGEGCRVTFWRGGIVLSALSREISEVRLVRARDAHACPAEAVQAEQGGAA